MTHTTHNESSEDYLETILILSHKLPVVRAVDIAKYMGFKKPSVSIAMKNLRQKNLITVNDSRFIYLTDEGKKIANMILERHTLITKSLIALGVSVDTATEDACRIEHDLSEETFSKLKEYIKTTPLADKILSDNTVVNGEDFLNAKKIVLNGSLLDKEELEEKQ
ncbi:iron (metal) dependent repressor, DtxR family [Lachnobacterium bovis DSM 14045]|jgi:Mn-dependent DtxR family transcriptional regulator|uniref:Iron (Metal) dependent repressor, DtxR family n=1 Tax=Lachnobacterium bovis DSM 14045 TaxID=1122142 RepID=A0A1H3J2L1_9FIRM|nr:metal-dependent transcriptional regulator [Lachnobacterium bovis]SDY34161.1 iron (metal) dependent repressor, DtxR family [Lachnobacterium bovis DSM 14045]